MAEVLIKAEGISKKFSKDLKKSLYYGLLDVFAGIGGTRKKRELRGDEFWAVKGISFEVKRGECIGLIGHNGAGKSTLLKMLNGLILPDTGSITMYGKVGALIELGAGFNPILTGRENIYNNAAVIGFSKKEIDAKFADIIEFAEIGDFLDMPVQNYSSGMKVRLGFAIAAQMEPDILIIDEVLAVGDLGFILKCFKQIDKILPNSAVIFVSHNMPMVSRICNEIILMEKGVAKYQGTNIAEGIDLYYSHFSQNDSNVIFSDGSVDFVEAKIEDNNLEKKIPILKWNNEFLLHLKFNNNKLTSLPFIAVTIFDKEQRPVALCYAPHIEKNIKNGFLELEVRHEKLQLSKGIYNINVSLSRTENLDPILRVNNIGSFQVTHNLQTWPPMLLDVQMTVFEQ